MSAVAAIRRTVKPPATPVILRADPVDRLVATGSVSRQGGRTRPLVLFAALLVAHLALLGLFIALAPGEPVAPAEEIAVEVVPPPESQVQPPPPEPPPPEPEQPKPEQPKPKEESRPPPPLDLKPAYDAPRAPTEETVDREAADKETASPHVAPPTPEAAANKQEPTRAEDKGTTAPTTQTPPAERAALDKPDAEAIEKAEEKPDNPQPTSSPDKPAPPSAGTPLFLQQLANLKPLPDYKLSGAATPAPVSGGTAQNNYLSVLFAKIMPHMRVPASVRTKLRGSVVIYIDTVGNVLHLGVVQPSGSPDLDSAAISAVRSAGRFPPPPAGLPPIRFNFASTR